MVLLSSLFTFIPDNVFSSLVGLQFMWKLMPKTSGLSHHLAHVPLKDSPLSDCGGLCGDLDIQIKLEEKVIVWYSFCSNELTCNLALNRNLFCNICCRVYFQIYLL